MAADKVTLRDVAGRAGVHPATASRALSPDTTGLVNAATAERVRQAAEALGYQPDLAARSLKTRRSHTVGVLVPDLTNPLFPPIVRGIEDVLAGAGYVALVGNTDMDDDRERLVLDRMRSRHVDGLILATARRKHPAVVEVASQGLPVVLVNRVVDDHTFASVAADDGLGIRLAAAHLVELGHRSIAHIAGPQGLSTGFGRYRGYLAGLEAHGLEA
ncbi:MAG: LacI family DNA-binding transcriptional regulator, partial [Acidimicrobiales bacterium]